MVARLKTWKPPLSVRMGSGQLMNLCSPPAAADDFHAGADVQVISVAEDDLRAHLAQFTRVNGFDAALRADRHEHRRINDAVGRGEPAQAGFGTIIRFQQLEHRRGALTLRLPRSTAFVLPPLILIVILISPSLAI